MNRCSCTIIACAVGFGTIFAQNRPQVKLETSLGEMVIELNAAKAPKTVENFLAYVNSGYYDGTIFHRVIQTFMIQGGGFTEDMQEKPTKPPIINEAANGLPNLRGTVAMARRTDPNSASSQFFINTVDNPKLDHRDTSVEGFGYCVFGRVVKGMETVDNIAKVPKVMGMDMQISKPTTPVIIKKATVVKVKAATKQGG
jgi:peptidyl-prolyl cis-trans isomerase B (cyclophilin B)